MQEKIHFEINIKAPVKKVWDTMLNQETYQDWTTPFAPGSYYEGSWEKGSKMIFLSSWGGGMVAEIADNIEHKYISIRHLGEIRDGVEDTTSERVMQWTPAYENYTFIEKGQETKLEVDMEMKSSEANSEMIEMFEEMWPKALLKLKKICER